MLSASRPDTYGYSGVSCDAIDENKAPVLFGYTCDMPRIKRFVHGLMTHGCEGVLYCFDFQEEAMRQVCGSKATIRCIDFDAVVRLLWGSE